MNKKVKEAIKKVVPVNMLRWYRDKVNQFRLNQMGKIEKVPFDKEAFPMGINLVGSFSHDSGLGQSCRLVAKELDRTDIPHNFIDFSVSADIPHSNHEFDGRYSTEYKYGINLFHINMHEFDKAYRMIGKETWNKHYNIAFWLWEMQEFPKRWIPMINQLDEIWTPAEFVSEAVRKVTDKPVYTIPYTVEAPYDEKYDRKHFDLPEDKFLFLMLFDSNSLSERKNPKAVIKAFKKAFPAGTDDVGMVIKIGNAGKKELDELRQSLEGYNVYYINRMLPKVEVNSLVRCVDVYVSLHRSEGYGLVLAEAMLLGTPTIATNYSANTEFQSNETACMVNYKMIPLQQNLYPYEKGYLWADADTDQAAAYMKELYSDKEKYETIKTNAMAYMNDLARVNKPVEILEARTKTLFSK